VKQKRLGLTLIVAVAAAAAAFALLRAHYAQPRDMEHRAGRQLTLYHTLSRIDDAMIVLGDSIVEASTLPRSLCGHAIVNAGLNGASTTSDLAGWLAAALNKKQAFAIIVSLGTNDALAPAPTSPQLFESRYEILLRELSKLTARLFVIEIPPVEARERLAPDMQTEVMATIRGFRSVLPELAARSHATFLQLEDMPAPFTIDGVHLNAAGYRAWDKAVMQAASLACG
jgi:lysophospholipase L1-like esterase